MGAGRQPRLTDTTRRAVAILAVQPVAALLVEHADVVFGKIAAPPLEPFANHLVGRAAEVRLPLLAPNYLGLGLAAVGAAGTPVVEKCGALRASLGRAPRCVVRVARRKVRASDQVTPGFCAGRVVAELGDRQSDPWEHLGENLLLERLPAELERERDGMERLDLGGGIRVPG